MVFYPADERGRVKSYAILSNQLIVNIKISLSIPNAHSLFVQPYFDPDP